MIKTYLFLMPVQMVQCQVSFYLGKVSKKKLVEFSTKDLTPSPLVEKNFIS